MAKSVKGYRFDTLTIGQLNKEHFRREKLSGLDEDANVIADEAIAALEGGGEVYAAYIDKKIAQIYIYSKSDSEDAVNSLELTSEYENYDLNTPEVFDAFDRDIQKVFNESSHDIIDDSDDITDVTDSTDNNVSGVKGIFSTKFSFLGMLLGFVVGYLVIGFGMNMRLMGIILGIAFGLMFGIVFSSYENAQKGAGIGDENLEALRNANKQLKDKKGSRK